jgi:uncharacterized protein with von Willebrand factor type A (vWA) domain
VLGKIAEVIIPAVNQLAQDRYELFLEAERRNQSNALRGLEQEIDRLRERLEGQERELKATEQALHKLLG